MRKNIKKILFAGFTVAAIVTAFTLKVKDSSLESLRANAMRAGRCVCVLCPNCDCMDSSTGTIYAGFYVTCDEDVIIT